MKKLLAMIYFSFCFLFVLTENVYAYIDPSVMTYAIQAIAGIAIALGAVVGVYIRKARRKINKKLGIDENKNKIVESDEIVVNKKSK